MFVRRALVRALIPIYLTDLVDNLGYSLLIPLLPIVAERFGAPIVVVGALLSAPAYCSMLSAPIWGQLSDRLGRKRVIVAATVFSFAGNLLLALSNSLPLLFFSRVVSGLGSGGGGGLDEAFIADVTTDEERDRAYALYGAVYGLGLILGPSISSALMGYGTGYPFLIAAALSLANVFLTQGLLPSTGAPTRKMSSNARPLLAALKTAVVRRLIVCHFLFIFAIVYFLGNLALYFEHVLTAPPSTSGWFLSGAAAVGCVAILFVQAPLAKRLGDRRLSLFGLTLSFIAYVLMTVVRNPSSFAVAVAVWAIGAAMAQPALTALLSERTDKHEMGAVMGITDSIYSLAIMTGPIIGSAVLDAKPQLFGIVPAGAVALAFVLIRRAASTSADVHGVG